MSFLYNNISFCTRNVSRPVLRRTISTAHAHVVSSTPTCFPPPRDLPRRLRIKFPAHSAMETQILPVDLSSPFISRIISQSLSLKDVESFQPDESLANLIRAARALCTSDVPVAFPTETVYGLAADAARDAPVENVFKVKGRPGDNPLIVHFASVDMLRDFLRPTSSQIQNGDDDPIPHIYRPLLEKEGFMPGPLTILLKIPAHTKLSRFVTGSNTSLPTFAARIPSSIVARALIQLAGVPIAAPSANVSGRPSPTRAEHVYADLIGKIEYIIDGGPCDVGVESTVVDGLESSGPAVLRPGGVGVADLQAVEGWNEVKLVGRKKGEAVRAPGMKYRHYAPTARVELVKRGEHVNVKGKRKVGVVSTGGLTKFITVEKGTEVCLVDLGADVRNVARGLFAALRDLDEKGVDTIYVEEVDEGKADVAVAVMNRLRKAAEEDGQ